jgi:aspartyl-tRNA synthetase
VIAREDNLINAKLATGEIEIVAKQIEILNTSKPVPFQIDVEDALGVAHQIQALTHTVEEKI